jgi:glycosyltransferase involved in cell wall biosynthesis
MASIPRILHWAPFGLAEFGGMETCSSTLRRELPRRGHWVVQPIAEPDLGAAAPAEGDLLLVESWVWPRIVSQLRARWPALPIVVRSGGNDPHAGIAFARHRLKGAAYESWLREVIGAVDLVISPSHFSAERFRSSDLGAIPTAVVTGGAPSTARRSSDDRAGRRIVVVAKFVEFKRIEDCIAAVAIAQRQIDVHLTLVGDGDLRTHLCEEAYTLLRPGTFEFTGALPQEECVARIATADVLLSMSAGLWRTIGTERYYHTETMGRSICEALCAGVPVVATRTGGVPESVGGDAGTLVEERDTHAAAHAIIEWLERQPPSPATVSVYRQRLGWDTVLARYDALLTGMLGRRAAIAK